MVMESSLDSHPSHCEQTVMHSRERMQNDRTQGPTAKAVPARAPYTFEDRVIVVGGDASKTVSKTGTQRRGDKKDTKQTEYDTLFQTHPRNTRM